MYRYSIALLVFATACVAPTPLTTPPDGVHIPPPAGPVPDPEPEDPPPPPAPPPVPTTGVSSAYGLWSPGEFDTCTKAQHDAYSTTGPDGKLYPTWHPAVDPSGCTFGHEHGRDPSGSALYQEIGPIPFGLANEALLESGGTLHRHEDHFGHKIEWINGAVFEGSGATRTCDVLAKVHQGSHSKDAFTNNLHEVAYHLRCSDGAEIHFTSLSQIGNGGELLEPCTSTFITAGLPTPAGSPGGVGNRSIPTRSCIDKSISGGPRTWVNYGHGLTENWSIDPIAKMASGERIAYLAMYFFIKLPSRYYDPAQPDGLARAIDLCYEVEDASDGRNMGPCKSARSAGVRRWDHPDSPFTGAERTLRWNQPILTNEGGPEVIYTDAFGRNGSTSPFPGSIRQFFAAMNNDGRNVTGPGRSGNFNALGVHAPN